MKQAVVNFFEGDTGKVITVLLLIYLVAAVLAYIFVFMPRGKKSGDRYVRFCRICEEIADEKSTRNYYYKRHLLPAIALVADIILYILVFSSERFDAAADSMLSAAFIISAALLLYYMIVFFFVDGGWAVFNSVSKNMHEEYRSPEYVTENEYSKWDYESDSQYTLKSSRTYNKNTEHNIFAFFMNLIWGILKIALAIGYAASHAVYYFVMTVRKLLFDRFMLPHKRNKAKKLFKEYLCTEV